MHMANAEYYWVRGLNIAPDVPALDAADYATPDAARAACQQADATIVKHVRGLSEADLERVPDGWGQPAWVGLLQNAHHSTDHRAQILRALHDMGAPTFDQAFADYMENLVPMAVEGLIGEISKARAKWDDAVRGVKDDQMDQKVMGDWSARDLIGIVTWKDSRVMEMARGRAVVGASFGVLSEGDQNSILERNSARPLEALIEQQQVAHR